MLIQRAFRYKLEPNSEQRESFLRFAGARRWIFNRGLEKRKKAFEATGKSPSYFEQNKELTTLKEEPETFWLKEVHSQVLQQALKDLDRAFENFFRRVRKEKKPGYPQFKKKGVRDSFRFPQGVKVERSKVFLPKIGWVKFRKSRDVRGPLKETTIVREGDDWFVSFSCEWEEAMPHPAPINETKAIGIDVGVSCFATTASGCENIREDIENPKFLKKLLSRLRYLSRQLSKKKKRSKNSLKAKIKLSKLHAHIKNLRNNFAQQLSSLMIKNHDIFCIESLDITSMLQKGNRTLSRSISDASWRFFFHCLKYKAQARGKHIVEVGRYFPSSQICACCNSRHKMPLFVRKYQCPNCGYENNRDYNSAIVLKAAGMAELKACGAALV